MLISLLTFSTIIFCTDADSKFGYCQPYNGKVCRKYLSDASFVHYEWVGGDSMRNEEITKGLWEELIVTLKEPCRSAAEVSL